MKSKEITIEGKRLSREKCYELYSRNVPTTPSAHDIFMRLHDEDIVILFRQNGITVAPLPEFDYEKLNSIIKGMEEGTCYAKAYGTYINPTDDLPVYHSYSYHPDGFNENVLSAIEYCFRLYSHKEYDLCYKLIRRLFSFSYTTLFVDEFHNSHKERGFRLFDLYRGGKKKYLEAVILYIGMMAFVNLPDLAEEIKRNIKGIKLSFDEAAKYFSGPKEAFVSRLEDFIERGDYFLFGRPERYGF